ncbi:hypothetical protein ACVWVY_001834 [Bradyrhizobium sp. URHC0002]
MTTHVRFPSPYDIKAPQGAEDWKRLYPYYLVFQDNLKQKEESKFWFCDSQHWPTPFKPFDAVTVEFAVKCLGQYNTRHYMIPPANGVDYRIHNGYCYMSPVAVAPELIAGRVPQFMERAGYYFQNWDSLLANWDKKVRANIAALEALHFEKLPDVVPLDWVTEGVGLDNTYGVMETYDRSIQLLYKTWQYHFEFLNLGYAAYLDFFGFLKGQFPEIPDQAIAKMVQGVDVDLFRPDDELKKLAKLAVQLDIATALRTGTADAALAAVAQRPNGQRWLEAWKQAQDPWFNFTSGNGFYSTDKYWIEHLDIPLGYIRDYIARLEKGEEIDRPTAKIAAERDRITKEYAELLDADARAAFEGKLGLARTVFPYVENHNFYIEHWSMGVFWAQDARTEPYPPRGRLLGTARRHVLSDAAGSPRRAVRLRQCLGGGHRSGWTRLLAGGDREPQEDHGGPGDAVAAAGVERTSRRDHRALHHHVVGHHHRKRRPLVERVCRQVGADRNGGVSGHRRRSRARAAVGRRSRSDRTRRNSCCPGYGAELGAGVRQDQGDRHRHRRDDVARGDRVPRIRPAGRDRHRQCDHVNQDRADAPRQRLDGRGHDPVLTKSNGVAAKPPPRETES